MSNAGWGGRGNRPWGLQRLRWTGKTPFEIHEMKAQPDGFTLSFTEPVHVESASDPKNYRMESYTYRLESRYGGPEDDKELKITKAVVSKIAPVSDSTSMPYVQAMSTSYISKEFRIKVNNPSFMEKPITRWFASRKPHL